MASAQQEPVHYFHSSRLPPGTIGPSQLLRGGPLAGYFQPLEVRGPEGMEVSVAVDGQFESSQQAPAFWTQWWQNEFAEATQARHLPTGRHLEQLLWAAWPVLPLAFWSLWLRRHTIDTLALPLLGVAITLAWFLSGPSRSMAVLPLLVDPLAPVPPTPAMRAATDRAVERFELASTFGRRAGASALRAGARRRADALRDRIPLAGRLLDRATRRREGVR
mgnify:CR=1 FL=1